MYTGIIQGMGDVQRIDRSPGLMRIAVRFPWRLRRRIQKGASISIDGVCLTVVKSRFGRVQFDVMQETLEKTTLGELQVGDKVNIERSARVGQENGGHDMFGHIIGTGEVMHVADDKKGYVLTIRVPKAWMKYFMQKGFVGLHGASLTVVDPNPEKGTFDIHLIPETREVTNVGALQQGDKVNIEIDKRAQTMIDGMEAIKLADSSDLHQQYLEQMK